MSPGGRGARLLGVVVALLVLLTVLAACGGDDKPERHTVGILRAVPASPDEGVLRSELANRDLEVTIRGGKADEIHPDPADARATVKAWVGDGVELVIALSTGSVLAAAEATDRVPIVFLTNDPVGAGLVRDARRPEGNATGVSYRVPADRTLLIAEQALGDLQRIGCVYASGDPASIPPLKDLQANARTLGIELQCSPFSEPAGAAAALQQAANGVEAVFLIASPAAVRAAPQLEAAAAGVPVPIVGNSTFSFAMLTLQPDAKAVYRQLAAQIDRLLDGAAISEVPVEDPGHYLLVVNLAVARRLGRTVPERIVDRADRVIR